MRIKETSEIINSIPGIEDKDYLELGVAGGGTFTKVRSVRKTGVDWEVQWTFMMSTDEFFDGPGKNMLFDVIYIDACHDYPQVRKDYNNAIRQLRFPMGLIFIHDMVPPNLGHTVQKHCSDSFRLLAELMDAKQQLLVQRGNMGLTVVFDPQPVPDEPNFYQKSVTYQMFMAMSRPEVNDEELMKALAERGTDGEV